MELKAFLKTKKTKNILYTLIEILIVAGLLFGAMMFVYNKVNQESESGSISNVSDAKGENQLKQKKKKKVNYYIEINKAKNAMIVYEYNDKAKKNKTPVKIFPCSIGKNLKKGSFKTKQDYQWMKSEGNWHQFNTRISKRCWIRSENYSDKYPYTMNRKSYDKIGKKVSGSSVQLYAGDAFWIYDNCKDNTEVKVIAGKKKESLPLAITGKINADGKCGWDPTDPSKENPFAKIKPGTIVQGKKIVYVEKGSKPSYCSNVLVLDEQGKSIGKKLKYKKFDNQSLGKHKVKFSVKTKQGKKLELTQEFKVIDTTCPKVTCSRNSFTLLVKSRSNEDLNNIKNLKKVENMVRPYVSCNEKDCKITINTVNAGELRIAKVPIIITATDKSGNVGSCQVMLEVKLENKPLDKSGGLSKKEKESLKERAKRNARGKLEVETTKEEVTKKPKEKTTKKEEGTVASEITASE